MACLERAGIAGLDRVEVHAIQFEHGEVGARVLPRENRGDGPAIGQRDVDPVFVSERVRRCDDDAIPPITPLEGMRCRPCTATTRGPTRSTMPARLSERSCNGFPPDGIGMGASAILVLSETTVRDNSGTRRKERTEPHAELRDLLLAHRMRHRIRTLGEAVRDFAIARYGNKSCISIASIQYRKRRLGKQTWTS